MSTVCDSVADYVMRCVVTVTFALHLKYSGMAFLKWMAQDLPLFHSKNWNHFKKKWAYFLVYMVLCDSRC